jgi:hypothetical protein
MNIYVAGKFQEYERVRTFIDSTLALGHTISFDWTRTSEFDDYGHPITTDSNLPIEVQQVHAVNDVNGVKNAEMIIVLGHENLTGAMIELGIAIQENKPAWIVDQKRWTIFYSLPNIKHCSHESEALRMLRDCPR